MDETGRIVSVEATPAPLNVDLTKTAVLVIDMQNDFGSKGGMFDRAGIDLSAIQRAVGPTAQVIASARAVGVPIIYIKEGHRPDLSDIGSVGSPYWRMCQRLAVGKEGLAPDRRPSRIPVDTTRCRKSAGREGVVSRGGGGAMSVQPDAVVLLADVRITWFSGDTLDNIVDYLTYVFVPAYAIAASGLLLASARATLLQIWSVDLTDGSRELEIEKTFNDSGRQNWTVTFGSLAPNVVNYTRRLTYQIRA